MNCNFKTLLFNSPDKEICIRSREKAKASLLFSLCACFCWWCWLCCVFFLQCFVTEQPGCLRATELNVVVLISREKITRRSWSLSAWRAVWAMLENDFTLSSPCDCTVSVCTVWKAEFSCIPIFTHSPVFSTSSPHYTFPNDTSAFWVNVCRRSLNNSCPIGRSICLLSQ